MRHVIRLSKSIPWVPLFRGGYKLVWLISALLLVVLVFTWKTMIFLLSLTGDDHDESAEGVYSEIKSEVAKEIAGLLIEFLN